MNNSINFLSFIRERPQAVAMVKGSSNYPDIRGIVQFHQTKAGVIVAAQVSGLPRDFDVCHHSIFAFHIHNGSSCSGNEMDPFANAMTHYNPHECPHPYHAGDMPPLFGANGTAFLVFLSDRFSVEEVIGKTVIIHSSPDDFTSQPSGNSGTKIACGVIELNKRL